MIQSNRVTIIPSDGAVYLDQGIYSNLDLSQCGIPEDVHALQFRDGLGHIEYIGHPGPNEDITELPNWAIKCIEKFEYEFTTNPPITTNGDII